MSESLDRIERLETAIFGDGAGNLGVLQKLGKIEIELAHTNRTLESINGHIAKIVWIILVAVLTAVLSLILRPMPTATGGNNASVTVGATEGALVKSQRDYLTVKEVAEKEKVEERTITSWIENGRLFPQPVKAGKAWTISANYRILPQLSEKSGNGEDPHRPEEIGP